MKNKLKKCGYKETCFVNGEEAWGHCGYDLCLHLYEKNDENGKCCGYCSLDDCKIDFYDHNRYNIVQKFPKTEWLKEIGEAFREGNKDEF